MGRPRKKEGYLNRLWPTLLGGHGRGDSLIKKKETSGRLKVGNREKQSRVRKKVTRSERFSPRRKSYAC